ncbi:MAG: hypothetical protein WD403_06825, partial [Pirellulales bacterium]
VVVVGIPDERFVERIAAGGMGEEFRARDGDSYGISMLKHALACTGTPVGPPRPPQRQLTRGEQTQIEALLPPILEAEAALAGRQPDLSRTR